MHYDWDLSLIWEFRNVFLRGTLVTLELTGITIVAGTLIGIPLGVFLGSRVTPVRWVVTSYVELLRALPPLVLLVCLYYFAPAVLNIKPSAFLTAAVGLSINLSAFVADVVRGALGGVPRSYVDAASAVGMPPLLILRRITLPEAIRSLVPTLTALYITMFKMSTLASVIACDELLHSATGIMIHTYRALETYMAIALIYLAILLPATYAAKRLEASRFLLRRV